MTNKTAWDHGIVNKWPAARATGPMVDNDVALEYIFRTDAALVNPFYKCNDHSFESELAELIGMRDELDWEFSSLYAQEVGHMPMHYLNSHWVASSYIFGPTGLISPVGAVELAKNFGKYPSVGEVEEDIEALSKAFPTLSFDLWLWDDEKEAEAVTWGSSPSHAWELTKGLWQRKPAENACRGREVPQPPSVASAVASIFGSKFGRVETTFTIERIEELWGERIATAKRNTLTKLRRI